MHRLFGYFYWMLSILLFKARKLHVFISTNMSPRKTYLGCDKQMVIVHEFYGRLPLIVSLSDTDIHIFRKTDILRNWSIFYTLYIKDMPLHRCKLFVFSLISVLLSFSLSHISKQKISYVHGYMRFPLKYGFCYIL